MQQNFCIGAGDSLRIWIQAINYIKGNFPQPVPNYLQGCGVAAIQRVMNGGPTFVPNNLIYHPKDILNPKFPLIDFCTLIKIVLNGVSHLHIDINHIYLLNTFLMTDGEYSWRSHCLGRFGSGQSPPNWDVVGFCLYMLTATNFVTQKQRYNFPLPQATPCNILSVRSF
jgi:hypothetical protein